LQASHFWYGAVVVVRPLGTPEKNFAGPLALRFSRCFAGSDYMASLCGNTGYSVHALRTGAVCHCRGQEAKNGRGGNDMNARQNQDRTNGISKPAARMPTQAAKWSRTSRGGVSA
jgi:hypothetical protein